MFKLIFRLVFIVMFLVILVIFVAVWKGGEPFRILGEGTTAAGHFIVKFGDMVDEIRNGGEKVGKHITEMKETLDVLNGDTGEDGAPPRRKEGPLDKDTETK